MFSHVFIDRPIFATVLSIVIVLLGAVALQGLPVAQYPDVTPPTVQVTTTYPGANAQVVADTVATPIEQEVNGVEDMLYMSSQSTNDGQMNLNVTFKLGTDIDNAQVLTQNRVAVAQSKLPEEVTQQGVTTKKKSPSILLCINLVSTKDNDGNFIRNQLFLSNYATINLKDRLARIDGVGDVSFLGPRDYSMRIWLEPDKLATYKINASDVVAAVREQNQQVSAGRIGQPPVPQGTVVDFQYAINTQGRLVTPEEFGNIVVKTGNDGQIVRVNDIARVELGAQNYDVSSQLDGDPASTLAVFQLPGSNALETAENVRAAMKEMARDFPSGMEYRIVYDTTLFVDESIAEVFSTLIEAVVLVFIVMLVFLQNWRTTVIPMIAVPVSLIGTFAVMALLGFSLNNLSLFGLVLAIGVVVDDAIVVVENVERWLDEGYSPRDASRKAMTEVSGAIVATSLVLLAVFVPTVFMTGISGQFYQQFALTIATSTAISMFNSLTLSPALCAMLLKPRTENKEDREAPLPWWAMMIVVALIALWLGSSHLTPVVAGWFDSENAKSFTLLGMQWTTASLVKTVVNAILLVSGAVAGLLLFPILDGLLRAFFGVFNKIFDVVTKFYGNTVALLIRITLITLLVYGGLLALIGVGFSVVPTGFIPQQDKGYLVANAQLPDGASLERSQQVVDRMTKIALETEGVAHVIGVPGYSVFLSTNLSNNGGMFIILAPFEERIGKSAQSANAILDTLNKKFANIIEADIAVMGAPPVEGLGSTGGFKMQVQDRRDLGSQMLADSARDLAQAAAADKSKFVVAFSSFTANQPQLFVEIDREKVKSKGVQLDDVNQTLQTYLGSAYANDFTFQNRNWQVNVQSEAKDRIHVSDIGRLQVRNADGQMIPLQTFITVKEISGPAIVNRYNLYPSADVNGFNWPWVSSSESISTMEELAKQKLPPGMSYEWTELTLLQILAGNTAVFVFVFGTIFVFLVLSAQYESWSLPLAVILIVPMCLLSAITGVFIAKMMNNIFTQIGLLVLVALAAKNAILIVEFAKQQQDEGAKRVDAAVDASRLRLRPILMTAFSFILGVVPLVVGQGAGAEMRNSLGVAVFSGMLGVTLFGLFFTPVFYVLVRWLVEPGSEPASAKE